jgi:RNase P/RNase MRP subunit p29
MAEDTIEDKLLIEEYKSCRELIGRNIDIIEKTEVYAVGAAGAIAD